MGPSSTSILTGLLALNNVFIYFVLSASTDIKFSIRGDIDWWKRTIIYEIYLRSFQDSDGDGVGDLKGIISRLDYFNYLNVGAIWLSPFYKSPMIDHGYDISDFMDVDPVFGTLQDFDQLIAEAHARGLYVIVDYIPNHSSDQHPWFIESRKGGADNPYSDYYIWTDGKILENGTRVPPNNWSSFFESSPWTWVEERQQYYFNQFAKEQPDLNYRNPKVREEMLKVFQFWLDRGVDGFRVDAVCTMFEVEDLSLNEPRTFIPNVGPHDRQYLDHIYSTEQPELHDVIKTWRQLLDKHDSKVGGHTFMGMEIMTTDEHTIPYYNSGADMPFNLRFVFQLKGNSIKCDAKISKCFQQMIRCDAKCFQRMINSWLKLVPEGKWPNFVLDSHDKNRVSARMGDEYVNALNVMLLTLPGTPTTYYGEEIGMKDIEVSYEDSQDPMAINFGPAIYQEYTRDPCRSPMQWNDLPFSGFSPSTTKKTWLPLHSEYTSRNVKVQMSTPGSTLHIYRRLAEIRQRKDFQNPDLDFHIVTDSILSYVRRVKGCSNPASYLIAINVGGAKSTDDYTIKVNGRVYDKAVVVLDTESFNNENSVISLDQLTLHVGQAFVLKLFNSEDANIRSGFIWWEAWGPTFLLLIVCSGVAIVAIIVSYFI